MRQAGRVALPYVLLRRLASARRGLEPAIRRAIFGDVPSWRRLPDRQPWFDGADAEAIAQRSGDPLLVQWVRDGWVVLDDCVRHEDIDVMLQTLDGVWDAPEPIAHLELLDVRETPDAPPRTVSHAEIVGWDAERRRHARRSNWRIHGFHYVNAAARRIFHARPLRDAVRRIFRRRPRPFAAINFMSGSEQELHQDMAVFHVWPRNWLLGAWIALEDITPDAGPLVFHSGSHRAPMFGGFPEYPQTNLRTADEPTAAAYQAWIDAQAARYPRHEFLARKGQVLLWHGMLFHGGAPRTNPERTRKSMVLHYTVRGADRSKEIRGPFRW